MILFELFTAGESAKKGTNVVIWGGAWAVIKSYEGPPHRHPDTEHPGVVNQHRPCSTGMSHGLFPLGVQLGILVHVRVALPK